MTVSIESQMTSRLTSEARIPSWPIEMPSETAIVTNSIGIAAGSADAFFAALGEPVERHVARRDLVPRRRDPDLRLVPVLVGHADGAQHRAGRALVGPSVTSKLRIFSLLGSHRCRASLVRSRLEPTATEFIRALTAKPVELRASTLFRPTLLPLAWPLVSCMTSPMKKPATFSSPAR